MIPLSVAITASVLVVVGLLIQPSLVFIVGVYMSSTIWGIYNDPGPRESLEQLLVAIQNQDTKAVRSLANKSSQSEIDLFLSAAPKKGDFPFTGLFEGVEITECSFIASDRATCTICMTRETNCEDLTLNKENNRWVVDFFSN